jgi:Phage gp6-like head-tail connector protein
MAAQLVTLATAKAHLRIDVSTDDTDIQLKLDQAEAVILEYLDTSVDAAWVSPATAPGPVTAAILLWLSRLYEHRGDADEADAVTWQAIERLLVRSRNAALA